MLIFVNYLKLRKTMENYHSDFTEMSSSRLKLFARSGAAYLQSVEDTLNGVINDSEPMRIGRVFHSYMEGNCSNYALFDIEQRPDKENGIKSKVNQAWKKEVIASHENVITYEQLVEIETMVEAVKNSEFYKAFAKVIEFVGNEKTYKAELHGLHCKCRVDRIYDDGENILIVDWKKTREELTKEYFQYKRILEKFKYDISMVHYCEILKSVYNRPITMVFVFVEDSAPYDSKAVYVSMNSEFYRTAYIKWFDLIKRAKFAIENKCFEGVSGISYELSEFKEKPVIDIIKEYSSITMV